MSACKLVLALCLLFIVNGNDFELIQQMNDFDFGRTILETVQIELQQGASSVDAIISQLREMKDASQSEINDAQTLDVNEDHKCSAQLDELKQSIKSVQAKKADDENRVPLQEESLNDKVLQLQDKQATEQRNKDQIQLLVQQRAADSQINDQRINDMQELIETLGEAKRTISQLTTNNLFLQNHQQIQQKLTKHQQKLQNLSPSNRGFVNMVQMLLNSALDTEVTQNPKLVLYIIQVIDELIDSLIGLQSVERKATESKSQIFITQKTRLEDEIGSLESTLANLSAEKETLVQSLLELNNDITSRQQNEDAKIKQYNDVLKTCNDQSINLKKTILQKNDEQAIIIQCLEIFEQRFTEGLRSYIQKIQIQQ